MPRTHTHTVCSCIYQNSISGKWARPCICVEIRDTEGALLCLSNVTLCMNSLSFDKKKTAFSSAQNNSWPLAIFQPICQNGQSNTLLVGHFVQSSDDDSRVLRYVVRPILKLANQI